MNLTDLTILEAHRALIDRDISSRELTQACLRKIEELDPNLNAFITVCREEALLQADQADNTIAKSQGIALLTGIPVAVKDNIITRGVRTTAASEILGNFIPPYDATVIRKLKNQNAVIVGKTNLDEFAMGSSTENSAYGVTKHPFDETRVPGGSSGGSTVAVKTGMAIYALGSDTGGSIRQPAALTGVVGLKPTYGRVSRYGLIAMCSSMDQIGPITKTVDEAEMVLQAIEGWDPYDATSLKLSGSDQSLTYSTSISDLKVGVPKEYFIEGIEEDVEKNVQQAISDLEDLGTKIVEISLLFTKFALPTYYIIVPSEISANLARYDGIRYGRKAQNVKRKSQSLIEEYLETRAEYLGKEVKRRIMLGTYALSSGYYDQYYAHASKVRALIKKDFDEAFKKVDVIVTPTSPTVAFKIGERQDPLSMYLADIFTVTANLAGIPGISIPCGHDRQGLPIGLQILGPRLGESKILCVADAYEKATD